MIIFKGIPLFPDGEIEMNTAEAVASVSEQPPFPFPFEDKHSFNTGGYVVTNEEVDAFRYIMQGQRTYRRSACIASGGEILLGIVLPMTSHEVIAVDHSYHSLAVTYLKCLMLKGLGPREFHRLMIEGAVAEFRDACEQYWKEAPAVVRKGYSTFNPAGLPFYTNDGFRKPWLQIPPKAIEASYRKLSKVRFLHGDVGDLPEGRFDLLYISNALDHTGRNHVVPNSQQWLKKLKSTGHLLYTAGSVRQIPMTKELRKLRTGGSQWTHFLHQLVPPPIVNEAAA